MVPHGVIGEEQGSAGRVQPDGNLTKRKTSKQHSLGSSNRASGSRPLSAERICSLAHPCQRSRSLQAGATRHVPDIRAMKASRNLACRKPSLALAHFLVTEVRADRLRPVKWVADGAVAPHERLSFTPIELQPWGRVGCFPLRLSGTPGTRESPPAAAGLTTGPAWLSRSKYGVPATAATASPCPRCDS